MNYIERIEDLLEHILHMRGTPYEGLLEVYALLVLIVGVECQNVHVHDAWSVWQNKTNRSHKSLRPFDDLTSEVQYLDEPYRQAIIQVAKIIN